MYNNPSTEGNIYTMYNYEPNIENMDSQSLNLLDNIYLKFPTVFTESKIVEFILPPVFL